MKELLLSFRKKHKIMAGIGGHFAGVTTGRRSKYPKNSDCPILVKFWILDCMYKSKLILDNSKKIAVKQLHVDCSL